MLMRFVAVMLLLSAGIAAEAGSYSFLSKASGRLGGPIRFEFYGDSTTRPKTDIESFTVSMRTADDRWKAVWSILSGRGLTQPIEYGVTPPGFTTMIQPQKLIPGRVYAGFASDGHGGSSGVTFGFDKNGKMTFRIHSIDEWRMKASNQSMKPTAPLRNKSSLFATTPCR